MAALTAIGFLLVAMGWLFGRRERHQRRDCDASHARTMAVIRAEHQRLVAHNAALAERLYAEQARARHLESCNQDLVIRAVLASSPLN
jgi:hypothetical protein